MELQNFSVFKNKFIHIELQKFVQDSVSFKKFTSK